MVAVILPSYGKSPFFFNGPWSIELDMGISMGFHKDLNWDPKSFKSMEIHMNPFKSVQIHLHAIYIHASKSIYNSIIFHHCFDIVWSALDGQDCWKITLLLPLLFRIWHLKLVYLKYSVYYPWILGYTSFKWFIKYWILGCTYIYTYRDINQNI